MNIYTFKSVGMLGQMYHGGEEVEMNGTDFYRVEDVSRERAEYAPKLASALKDAEKFEIALNDEISWRRSEEAKNTELQSRLQAQSKQLQDAAYMIGHLLDGDELDAAFAAVWLATYERRNEAVVEKHEHKWITDDLKDQTQWRCECGATFGSKSADIPIPPSVEKRAHICGGKEVYACSFPECGAPAPHECGFVRPSE